MKWTQEDDKFLYDHWEELSDRELAEKLGTSRAAIKQRRSKFDLKRQRGTEWTDDEKEKIKNNYQQKTDRELAEELGRSKSAVGRKRRDMGLEKRPGGRTSTEWDKEDVEFLKGNYDDMPDRELASELDKSQGAIQRKRYSLDLKKDHKRGGFYGVQGEMISVDEKEDETHITYAISDGKKRKIKGDLGEMLAEKMEGRLEEFLEVSLNNEWETFGWRLNVINPDYRSRFVGGEEDREIVERNRRPTIRHYGSENLKESPKGKYVVADSDLLNDFKRLEAPTVDKNLYAVQYGEETREVEFRFIDISDIDRSVTPKDKEEIEEKLVSVELPVINDFLILALEVKTTTSNVKRSLTEVQKEALERSEDSEHLRFYTMKISVSPEDFDIPDEAEIDIRRWA